MQTLSMEYDQDLWESLAYQAWHAPEPVAASFIAAAQACGKVSASSTEASFNGGRSEWTVVALVGSHLVVTRASTSDTDDWNLRGDEVRGTQPEHTVSTAVLPRAFITRAHVLQADFPRRGVRAGRERFDSVWSLETADGERIDLPSRSANAREQSQQLVAKVLEWLSESGT